MLGKEENQTEKRTNSGEKKKTEGRGKERMKDLRQLKKRKAMIYHREGEVE